MSEDEKTEMDHSEMVELRERLKILRDHLRDGTIPPELFDMKSWPQPTECGSVMCIGGWLEAAFRRDYGPCEEVSQLFFPESGGTSPSRRAARLQDAIDGVGRRWEWTMADPWSATPPEAADAIDRWLDGEDPWPSAPVEEKMSCP